MSPLRPISSRPATIPEGPDYLTSSSQCGEKLVNLCVDIAAGGDGLTDFVARQFPVAASKAMHRDLGGTGREFAELSARES